MDPARLVSSANAANVFEGFPFLDFFLRFDALTCVSEEGKVIVAMFSCSQIFYLSLVNDKESKAPWLSM